MENKHGIGYYFKLISKSLEASFKKELLKNDITYQQFNILNYLFKNNDIDVNQKMLENHFELSNATISGILKRLEVKELIIREKSKKDHRDKIIKLSDKGNKIKYEFINNRIRNDEILLSGFSESEKEELGNYLSRIKNNIREVL